jgi:hypothetical protein
MTDTTIEFAPVAEPAERNYLNEQTTLWSWLTTTDHKRIGILYAFSIMFFFFIGGLAISIVRLELLTPQGGLVSADVYNRLFSLHGIIMVWFFLVPSIPTTLGNFLLPMMIGAHDVAFPRLNLLSWYVFMTGALFAMYVLVAGGVDTGWTFYTPLSTNYATGHVAAAAAGVFITGFSTIAAGVNFVATIHMLRAPGMTWFRLPLFVWGLYAVSLVMLLATPVYRAALSRILGPLRRDHDVSWFHHNILSTIRDGVRRDAAALSNLPARVPGLPRHLHGRSPHSRRRLHPAACLSRLVVALRQARRRQSLGRNGTRMAHQFAAAEGEFQRDAAGRGRALSLP